MPGIAYIGFGTNVGDVSANYAVVRDFLDKAFGLRLLRTSELYTTEPLTCDVEPQPWYLNCVFEMATELNPHELFATLKDIERKMGRRTQKRWAPRVADLDILFYDQLIYTDAVLTLPHHGITQRSFVLTPLCDLIPNFIHPVHGLSLQEILHCLPRTLEIRSATKSTPPQIPQFTQEVMACSD